MKKGFLAGARPHLVGLLPGNAVTSLRLIQGVGGRMAQQNVTRKLAAILATDVVGYSQLMAADEDTTIRTLDTYRQPVDGLAANHPGRVFDCRRRPRPLWPLDPEVGVDARRFTSR